MNQIEMWQWASFALAMAGAFVTAIWGLGKVLLRQITTQIEARFDTQEQQRKEASKRHSMRFDQLEKEARQREREHLELLAQLPREFVRREDHIRFETAIHGKLDALYKSIELLTERLK